MTATDREMICVKRRNISFSPYSYETYQSALADVQRGPGDLLQSSPPPPLHFIAGIDGGAPHRVKNVFLSLHPRLTVTTSSTLTPIIITLKTIAKNFEIRKNLNYGFVFP
jgi:hypothetical protein